MVFQNGKTAHEIVLDFSESRNENVYAAAKALCDSGYDDSVYVVVFPNGDSLWESSSKQFTRYVREISPGENHWRLDTVENHLNNLVREFKSEHATNRKNFQR